MAYLNSQQCGKASCYLDGKVLLGDIEEINLPDIDPETVRPYETIDVELKGRDIQSVPKKPKAQLEIRLPIKDDVQAIWRFWGRLTCKQDTLTLATTLKVEAVVYKHTINGEEKHYIDAADYVCRINGEDLWAKDREMLGIETPSDRL